MVVLLIVGFFSNPHLILPGLVGKVDFTVKHLTSDTTTFTNNWSSFTSGQQCIGNGARQVEEKLKLVLCSFCYVLS